MAWPRYPRRLAPGQPDTAPDTVTPDTGPHSAEPADQNGSFQAVGQLGPSAHPLSYLPRELPDVVSVRVHVQVGEVGGVQLAGFADGLRRCCCEQPLGL